MEEKKLVIRSRQYSGESTVVSIRIPKDMLSDIDAIAERTGRTRTEIMLLSLEFALKHTEIE